MPREAINDELDLLRSDGQAAKLYAAFFPGNVIYSAVLASVPSSTDQIAQISFTSGSGTLANVKPDMLLKAGSTAGGQELGIARIRKAPIAGTFYIGEQSIIDWSAVGTVYLTVTDDYDMHARHVRIDGTTIYMDYDIAFSDQHTIFSPVPVLGPIVRVVKLIGGTGTVQIGPEAGYHSWVIGSTISSHLWSTLSSGVSFSSTSVESPTLTITAPGWKVLYDLVTAANGKTRQGVRYVYAWDADNPPLTVFTLGENAEDHKQGGCNFTLVFPEGVTLSEIPDRALCVFFSEDYYGAGDEQEQISIGAVTGAENILYTGRVIAESLTFDDETQTASIEIQGYQELMKRVYGFPAGLRFKITPTSWVDMPAMTVDRALYHLLEYHTTAITIMDFNRTGDTRYTARASAAFTSIWEQMQETAYKQIFANARVDHLGRLWFDIDPLLLHPDDRDYPVVMELTDNDLTGRVEFVRETLSEIGKTDVSGVVIDGGGNASAFFSISPGHIHDRTGRIDVNDYLLLEDQTQANEIAGLLWAAKNNPYKPMRLKLRANNRLVTCFPNQAITYTISAANNPRGFAITKNWIPRQRKLSYDPETGQLSVELIIEAETEPMHAVTGDIPGSSDFSFPPLPGLPSLPSIPVILPGGTGPVSDGGPPVVLIHAATIGLVLTQNFDSSDPEWYTVNGGLTATEYQNITKMMMTPNGAIWVMGGSRSGGIDYFIKRAPFAGGTFETIESQASINTKLSTTGRDGGVGLITCNRLLSEYVAYTLVDIPASSSAKVYHGNYPSFAAGVSIPTSDPRIGDLSYGLGKWIFTGNGLAAKFFRIDAGLTTVETSASLDHGTQHKHRRISTTGDIYHFDGAAQTISTSENNCASFVDDYGANYATSPFDPLPNTIFTIDPTGRYIMTDRSTTGKGRSNDFGATLNDITNLPFTGHNWRFAHAGGTEAPLRWVAVSGGGYVYYTDDYFNSAPDDKRGNLLDLVGVLTVNDVIVVSM